MVTNNGLDWVVFVKPEWYIKSYYISTINGEKVKYINRCHSGEETIMWFKYFRSVLQWRHVTLVLRPTISPTTPQFVGPNQTKIKNNTKASHCLPFIRDGRLPAQRFYNGESNSMPWRHPLTLKMTLLYASISKYLNTNARFHSTMYLKRNDKVFMTPRESYFTTSFSLCNSI